VSTPHLPPDVPAGPSPQRVVPLGCDLGTAAGHRVHLLSLEVWPGFADLRFARVDEGDGLPLKRRVPPAAAWTVTVDGAPLEVWEAVGRGDRRFSNGEVRLRPAPPAGARLTVEVALSDAAPTLVGEVTA
jgi:hypothetical protein